MATKVLLVQLIISSNTGSAFSPSRSAEQETRNKQRRFSHSPFGEAVLEGGAADRVPPHGEGEDPVEAEPELGDEQPERGPPPQAAAVPRRDVGGPVEPYQEDPGEDGARVQPVRHHPLRLLRREQRRSAAGDGGDAAPGHPWLAASERMQVWSGWSGTWTPGSEKCRRVVNAL